MLLRGLRPQLSNAVINPVSTSFRATPSVPVDTTYTPTPDVKAVIVFVLGSGAPGAGTADSGIWGTGGGSGGYAFKAFIFGAPNPTHTITDIANLYAQLPAPYAAMLTPLTPSISLTYLPYAAHAVYCPASLYRGVTGTGPFINDDVGYAMTPSAYNFQCTISTTTASRFAGLVYGVSGYSGINGSDGQCGYAPYYRAGAPGAGVGGDYNDYGMQGGLTARCAASWSPHPPATAWAAQAANYECGAPSILYPTQTPRGTAASSIAYGCGGGGRNTSGSGYKGAGGAIEIFEFK